jgi:hypothetical protein
MNLLVTHGPEEDMFGITYTSLRLFTSLPLVRWLRSQRKRLDLSLAPLVERHQHIRISEITELNIALGGMWMPLPSGFASDRVVVL